MLVLGTLPQDENRALRPDIVVYKKGADLENTPPAERSQSNWESFKSAQVADRILFVTFLTSAAATAALLFLTDFDRADFETHKVAARTGVAVLGATGGAALAPAKGAKGLGKVADTIGDQKRALPDAPDAPNLKGTPAKPKPKPKPTPETKPDVDKPKVETEAGGEVKPKADTPTPEGKPVTTERAVDTTNTQSPASRGYDRPEIETRSGKAVREKDATYDWDEFLGENQRRLTIWENQRRP